MKTVHLIWFVITLAILCGCSKSTSNMPTPDVSLSKTELKIMVGDHAEVAIKGGDGENYTITPNTSEIASAKILNKTVTINALKEGVVTFTIASKGSSARLKVIVSPKPLPEIALTEATVELYGGDTKELKISGGDGMTYLINPEHSEIADVSIADQIISISGKNVGSEEFIIMSGGKKTTLTINVVAMPLELTKLKIGVYKDGKAIFNPQMTSKMKKGTWVVKENSDPYAVRIFISKYKDGDTEIGIISYGLAPDIEDTSGKELKIPIVVEKKLQGDLIQVRSGKIRFVTRTIQ